MNIFSPLFESLVNCYYSAKRLSTQLPNKINYTLPTEKRFGNEYSIPIGLRTRKDVYNLFFNNNCTNVAIVGSPGSGKSNLLHVIVNSIYAMYNADFTIIDLKRSEFSIYENAKRINVVTNANDVVTTLQFILRDINNTYDRMNKEHKRYIHPMDISYHRHILVIDEINVVASGRDRKKILSLIERIICIDRACLFNVIICGQRMSSNDLTPAIRACLDLVILFHTDINTSNLFISNTDYNANNIITCGRAYALYRDNIEEIQTYCIADETILSNINYNVDVTTTDTDTDTDTNTDTTTDVNWWQNLWMGD